MADGKILRTVEAAAILLFFVQAMRVLFSVLFGIIYDAVFAGPMSLSMVVSVLLALLAFLTPLLAPRRRRGIELTLLATSLLVLLSRIPMTLNNPELRLYSSLLIVAGGGLYAAALLRQRAGAFPGVFIAALVGDQLFRALGDTFDITLRDGWLPYQVVISLALAVISAIVFSRPPRQADGTSERGLGFLGGLAIGAFLFLETSLLAFPNAMARWSMVSYSVLTPSLLLITLLPLLPGVQALRRRLFTKQVWGLLLSLFTCLCLAVGYLWQGFLAGMALLLAQLLVLLALPCAAQKPGFWPKTRLFCTTENPKSDKLPIQAEKNLVSPTSGKQGKRERIGLNLALGLIFFLLINFAFAFAFTYAYTLEFFRGAGLPIVIVAGIMATLPAARRRSFLEEKPPARQRRWSAAGIVGIAVLVILSAVFARPPAVRLKQAGPNVRVGTYNIHYGYNTPWQFRLEEMARTIEESGADIVALQEVDTCRITSYGVDDALWLARRLRMEVIYQPTVEHLTGIALLSRFPVRQVEGKLLTSRLEQTAIVRAQVEVGDDILEAYDIWLGLEPEERAVQLGEALDVIREGPAIFGGDFNSTPDSPIYRQLVDAGFTDGAAAFDPSPTSPSETPRERIDYVWLRGLRPVAAKVLDSTASDHRMVLVEAVLE
ncbi:MAG: endonuclease/exonuclease/phosphatase family protein [Anaerolineae bacterium]